MAKKRGVANKDSRKPIEGLDYRYQYGKDLESCKDIIQGNTSTIRIFCSDCKKYYMIGKYLNNKYGHCKGKDLQWAVCPYRKIALEVMKYE